MFFGGRESLTLVGRDRKVVPSLSSSSFPPSDLDKPCSLAVLINRCTCTHTTYEISSTARILLGIVHVQMNTYIVGL